jgi:hypothetical protein
MVGDLEAAAGAVHPEGDNPDQVGQDLSICEVKDYLSISMLYHMVSINHMVIWWICGRAELNLSLSLASVGKLGNAASRKIAISKT